MPIITTVHIAISVVEVSGSPMAEGGFATRLVLPWTLSSVFNATSTHFVVPGTVILALGRHVCVSVVPSSVVGRVAVNHRAVGVLSHEVVVVMVDVVMVVVLVVMVAVVIVVFGFSHVLSMNRFAVRPVTILSKKKRTEVDVIMLLSKATSLSGQPVQLLSAIRIS